MCYIKSTTYYKAITFEPKWFKTKYNTSECYKTPLQLQSGVVGFLLYLRGPHKNKCLYASI